MDWRPLHCRGFQVIGHARATDDDQWQLSTVLQHEYGIANLLQFRWHARNIQGILQKPDVAHSLQQLLDPYLARGAANPGLFFA